MLQYCVLIIGNFAVECKFLILKSAIMENIAAKEVP